MCSSAADRGIILEKIVVGPLEVNCYILGCRRTREAVIIDAGDDADKIKECLRRHNLKPLCIVATHGHADHIGANYALSVPVYIHRMDSGFLESAKLNLSEMLGRGFTSPSAERVLEEADVIDAGDIHLKVLHTPGHTPGGICLDAGIFCFTGDTLFAQSVGRTDLPGASTEALIDSIRKKLLVLGDDVVIYPGHGSSSTIGWEKKHNPFI